MAKRIDPKKVAKAKQGPTTQGAGGGVIRGKDVIFRTADGTPVGTGAGGARSSRLRTIVDVFKGKHRKNG